jgi:hypothetical protein
MERAFDFEDLDVYQKSVDFTDIVYAVTKKYPKGFLEKSEHQKLYQASLELSKMLAGLIKSV